MPGSATDALTARTRSPRRCTLVLAVDRFVDTLKNGSQRSSMSHVAISRSMLLVVRRPARSDTIGRVKSISDRNR